MCRGRGGVGPLPGPCPSLGIDSILVARVEVDVAQFVRDDVFRYRVGAQLRMQDRLRPDLGDVSGLVRVVVL